MAATSATVATAPAQTPPTARRRRAQARCAIFYSISATQPGLAGIDLGSGLIKRAAAAVRRRFVLQPYGRRVPKLVNSDACPRPATA
jgi:hypothetical protein